MNDSNQPRKLCRRYDIVGDPHMLTFSCFKRLPLLSKDRSRKWMLDAIQLGRERELYDLWAYVIMPEHVHMVVLPRENVQISQILALVKQSMAKRAMPWIRENAPGFLTKLESRSKGKSTHQFWQRGGGYDRNLRSVSDIHEKIDYIHANPVRRKLVDTPGQWPWSSYHTWETGKDAPIPVDRDSVPMLTPVEEDVRRNIRRYEH